MVPFYEWVSTVYVFANIIAALSCFTLIILFPRDQGNINRFSTRFLLGLGSLWASSYALSPFYHTPNSILLLLGLQVIPIALLGPTWLLFILGRTGMRARWWQSFLFVIPIATILITWYPQTHEWMWSIQEIQNRSGLTLVQYGRGVWYYHVFIPYNVLLSFIGLGRLISAAVKAPPSQRWEFYVLIWTRLVLMEGVILFSVLVPFWQAFRSFDLTPIGLTAASIIYVVKVSQHRLLPTSPLAYQQIFGKLELAMLVIDPQHKLLDYNGLAARRFGLTTSDLMTEVQSLFPFITPDHWETLQQKGILECKDLETYWQITQSTITRDAPPHSSSPLGYVLCLSDISEQRKLQTQLLEGALLYDPLTQLPNRTLFMKRLEEKLQQKTSLNVLFLDLDRFKSINDSLGHRAGDHLLQRLGEQIYSCLSPQDMLARFGGDEFAILMPDSHDLTICDRIQAAIQLPIPFENYQLQTSASIGVARVYAPDDHTHHFQYSSKYNPTASQLIRNADLAMYQAKSAGKACYRVYNDSLHQQAMATIQMESDLRQAFEQEEFELYYQPIVHIQTDEIVGVEALLRWHHPSSGQLSPPAFLSSARDLNMMPRLDTWVIQTACDQYFQWRQRYPDLTLTVSVNVSAQNWGNPQLLSTIQRCLQGQDASWLKLEISEDTLLNNALDHNTLIQKFRNLGVSLQLDDFGTGYSSLSYLCQIYCNGLKIDQSFVRNMENTPKSKILLKTIVDLAHALDLSVVAEGIETQRQKEFLQALGCIWGQGYLWSKPISAQELETRFIMREQPV